MACPQVEAERCEVMEVRTGEMDMKLASGAGLTGLP